MLNMMKLCFLAIMICRSYATPYSQCATVGSTYAKYFDDSKSWQEAKEFCESDGGNLLVAASEESNAFLVQVDVPVWIGGKYEQGQWNWVNGEPIDETDERWTAGEPNNSAECMQANYEVDGRKAWDDTRCSVLKPFVCEYQFTTSRGGEAIANREVKRHATEKTFAEAENACENAGGLLVVPDDEEIKVFLQQQNTDTWVGATDEASEGEWVMSNGDTLSTDSRYWAVGMPDNARRVEHCALYSQGGLNDRYCMDLHPYACQWAFQACTDEPELKH